MNPERWPVRRTASLLAAIVVTAGCGPAPKSTQTPAASGPPSRAVQWAAVRTWSRFVLAREAPASRLFVEAYFMRGLAAGAEVLSAPECSPADRALADSARTRARAFADSLVHTQDARGYWKLGYASGWVADMAAAVATFGSLEPAVDAQRLAAYEACAAKFVRGLERDGLLLDSGGVGLGWPLDENAPPGARAWRSDIGWSDSEYLVATALAGIEVNAWLYHRTHADLCRTRARKALDVTWARMKTDGSFPTAGPQEGPLQVAFYVQEGWMAAAAWLDDPDLTAKICIASAVHTAGVIAAQQPDGTWMNGNAGDTARSDGLVNFLLWRQAHCGPDLQAQQAIARSGSFLLQPPRWTVAGAFPAGPQSGELNEIRRALLGRPLAAVVQGRPVL